MSKQVGTVGKSLAVKNARLCRYSPKLSCIVLLMVVVVSLSHHLILQLNCQRYQQQQQQPLTTSTHNNNNNCNHHNQTTQKEHLRHLRQPFSSSSNSRQQRQFNQQLTKSRSQQQQVNEQQQQQQQQQYQRQHQQQIEPQSDQEEFSLAATGSGQVVGATSQQLQLQQTATISNYTLLPSANQQPVAASVGAVATEQPNAQVNNNNNNQTATSTDASQLMMILNTTPANPSDSIVSPVVLQPPATTASSSIVSSNTVAPGVISGKASPGNSFNHPSQVTVVTTTTSSNAQDAQSTTSVPSSSTLNGLDQGQGQGHLHLEEPTGGGGVDKLTHSRATGRRMEDSATTGVNNGDMGAAISVPADHQYHQARSEDSLPANNHQVYSQVVNGANEQQRNHLQSVSSAPSSISIITPLIGPPNNQQQQSHTTSTLTATIGAGVLPTGVGDNSHAQQQQQQQSAMMKPIYVVGNPISERDYGNSLYYHQYQAPPVASPSLISQQQVQSQSAPVAVDSVNQQPVVSQVAKIAKQQQPGELVVVAHSSSTSDVSANSQKIKSSASESLGSIQQHTARFDKSQELAPNSAGNVDPQQQQQQQQVADSAAAVAAANAANATAPNYSNPMGDRISGPPLVYSDGRLQSSLIQQTPPEAINLNNATGNVSQQPASPRLFQGQPGAAVQGNNPRRPSLPPPVNQANAASGFRSPMSPSGPLLGNQQQQQQQVAPSMNSLQAPINNMAASSSSSSLSPHNMAANFYQTASPYANTNTNNMLPLSPMYNNAPQQQQQQQPNMSPPTMGYNKQNFLINSGNQQQLQQQQSLQQALSIPSSVVPTPMPGTAPGSGRRPLNITRVEHISAECANDLIRAVIVFNGTFKGIIYSSGYVNDPTCLYVNGTGSTRYEFNIRLNQCGTLGRQELHQPTIPGEARRRDQVMWNTLSIQYNSIIEQEWDEHFRVSCEYGSDFWKTVSFSPFNVETNTGSPVVFTINPPQCQMDVLLGHGMGPKIAVDGPVTVGDPLTLLIHMKSEKAGYDILVKNCVAHNGGKQRMQLIDANGCVVNERFISPFRGTYNDNDLRHVTLYAYLKAFRFTGSPVLYLECEIHMCQSACPPQMCYWRRLSKRSVDNFDYEYTTNSSNALTNSANTAEQPIISDSLNLFKALQVRQESEPQKSRRELKQIYAEDDEAQLVCYRNAEVLVFITTMASLLVLVFTIALTCWIRVRKLTRSQFQHNRLLAASSSLSPSLLSIGDAISSAGSIIGTTGNSLLSLAAAKTAVPVWQAQQQQQLQRHHQSGAAAKLPPNLYHARPHVYHPQATR